MGTIKRTGTGRRKQEEEGKDQEENKEFDKNEERNQSRKQETYHVLYRQLFLLKPVSPNPEQYPRYA